MPGLDFDARRFGGNLVPILFGIVVLVVVLSVRIGWGQTWGSSVAFWDQWETEGVTLLVPWHEGRLGAVDLLRNHNEHRIVLQRLWTLAAQALNEGQWDNLAIMAGLSLLWAAFLGWLVWHWSRRVASPLLLPVLAVLLAAVALPYPWENMTVALQATFLQLMGLTLVALQLAADPRDGPWRLAALLAVCLLALLTVASGVLTAVAAGLALALRAWVERAPLRGPALSVGLLAIVFALGVATLPAVPGHAPLRAQDPDAFVHALGVVLSWPFGPGWNVVPALWLPWTLLLLNLLLRRSAVPARWRWPDIVMVALGAWVLAQAAATAYSRGHLMDQLGARYTEVIALGLVVAVYAAWRPVGALALPRPVRGLAALVAVAFTIQAVQGLRQQAELARPLLEQRAWLYRAQLEKVREHVRAGDPGVLIGQPHLHVPFPDAHRLIAMLALPTLRSILPAAIAPPQSLCAQLPTSARTTRRLLVDLPATACPSARTALVGLGIADAADLPDCGDPAFGPAGARAILLPRTATDEEPADRVARCLAHPDLAGIQAVPLGRVSAWLESWRAPTRVPKL